MEKQMFQLDDIVKHFRKFITWDNNDNGNGWLHGLKIESEVEIDAISPVIVKMWFLITWKWRMYTVLMVWSMNWMKETLTTIRKFAGDQLVGDLSVRGHLFLQRVQQQTE